MSDVQYREASEELASALRALHDARRVKRACDAAEKDASKRVKDLLDLGQVVTRGGIPIAQFAPVSATRFDVSQFREDYPDLATQYTLDTTQERLDIDAEAFA